MLPCLAPAREATRPVGSRRQPPAEEMPASELQEIDVDTLSEFRGLLDSGARIDPCRIPDAWWRDWTEAFAAWVGRRYAEGADSARRIVDALTPSARKKPAVDAEEPPRPPAVAAELLSLAA